MVIFGFAESLFLNSIITHVSSAYYVLYTGLDSREYFFLFNKHLYITFLF